MAVYKVPQDVEAEDKLIGPFSFRQFIYLMVAALGIFISWALSQIFLGLLLLPLPIVVAFLALALPLRKDQPMETYLVAILKFYFKPRNRLWDPEGTISMVQITAPRVSEGPELKEYGGEAAGERLAYLAQIVDTHGWSTRGAVSANDSLSDIFVAEASHAEDILDETSSVTRDMERRINLSDDAHLEAARRQMQQLAQQPQQQQPQAAPIAPIVPPMPPVQTQQFGYAPLPAPAFNPYPAMHQHVVDPSGQAQPYSMPQSQTALYGAPAPTQSTMPLPETVSPDIMRLANTKDLSISALAHEAHRLDEEYDNQEVVVKLH